MTDLKAYLGVARAPFLLLPVTLVAAGAAAAAWDGRFAWGAAVLALVGLVALHMAVNILNEVSDFATRIDFNTARTPFSGGSGTLPSGAMSAKTARTFGLACAAVGAVIGGWFLTRVGWPLIPVMLLGALAVLAYTPALASSGLGEIFAGLGLGVLPVWGTALVVRGQVPGAAAVAVALPAFFMTFNLLLLNEFPDEAADRQGGRRNIVLLLGRRSAAIVYTVAALAVPVTIVVSVALRILPLLALAAVLPSLMLVAPLRWALTRPQESVPVPALGANVVWNLATNTLLAVTLAVATAL